MKERTGTIFGFMDRRRGCGILRIGERLDRDFSRKAKRRAEESLPRSELTACILERWLVKRYDRNKIMPSPGRGEQMTDLTIVAMAK